MPTDSTWPNKPNTTTSTTGASWSVSASHKMPWSLGFTAPWLPADAPGQGRTPSHHSSPTPEPVSRHWSCPSGVRGSRRLSVLCPEPQSRTRSSGSTLTQPRGSGSQPSLKSILSLPATHWPPKPRRRGSSRQLPDHTELLLFLQMSCLSVHTPRPGTGSRLHGERDPTQPPCVGPGCSGQRAARRVSPHQRGRALRAGGLGWAMSLACTTTTGDR